MAPGPRPYLTGHASGLTGPQLPGPAPCLVPQWALTPWPGLSSRDLGSHALAWFLTPLVWVLNPWPGLLPRGLSSRPVAWAPASQLHRSLPAWPGNWEGQGSGRWQSQGSASRPLGSAGPPYVQGDSRCGAAIVNRVLHKSHWMSKDTEKYDL
ncbi:hypothetical protein P7K49_002113 [Saguinus oedipus]|uniref:Uncharacterized protein n=1 Tax=Saguinus oedipus TaxID=9490 RepID=A0ABQ9WKB1_SAGOE|nr:hypothetical protein P7K49_002113 [Saguinus oedipus]